MAGQNVPLMLTQGITVTNDSLVHFMPDTTPRAAKKVYLVFLSLSAVWTLRVWGAAGELIHDLRSKGPVYTVPDSYRRAATFVSDRGAIYITPELSDK